MIQPKNLTTSDLLTLFWYSRSLAVLKMKIHSGYRIIGLADGKLIRYRSYALQFVLARSLCVTTGDKSPYYEPKTLL